MSIYLLRDKIDSKNKDLILTINKYVHDDLSVGKLDNYTRLKSFSLEDLRLGDSNLSLAYVRAFLGNGSDCMFYLNSEIGDIRMIGGEVVNFLDKAIRDNVRHVKGSKEFVEKESKFRGFEIIDGKFDIEKFWAPVKFPGLMK